MKNFIFSQKNNNCEKDKDESQHEREMQVKDKRKSCVGSFRKWKAGFSICLPGVNFIQEGIDTRESQMLKLSADAPRKVCFQWIPMHILLRRCMLVMQKQRHSCVPDDEDELAKVKEKRFYDRQIIKKTKLDSKNCKIISGYTQAH